MKKKIQDLENDVIIEGHGIIHKNNCSSTEAFVLFQDLTGTENDKGICIEKIERPSRTWRSADKFCKALGKRLPDFNEWKEACDNSSALGLLNMPGNWEWASSIPGADISITPNGIITGNSDCNGASLSSVRNNYWKFRCVH